MSWKFNRETQPPTMSMAKKSLIFVWEVAKVVIISIAIIVPVRYYLIKPFYVKGASMEPNFYDKEYLIIDEITYRFNQPERGDIVVFRYPGDPSQFFIKRVIGMPGEQVRVTDHVIIYNSLNPTGEQLEELYLSEDALTKGNGLVIELGPEQYFLMGDNRGASLDSRAFGAVGRDAIIGKVLLRGWPLTRAGLLTEDVEYNL